MTQDSRFYLCPIIQTQIMEWIYLSYKKLFVGPANIPRATYFSKTDKKLHPSISQIKFFSFDLF